MKKSEKQRVKEFISKHMKVNNPRSIKDEKLCYIIETLNQNIVNSCQIAFNQLNNLK